MNTLHYCGLCAWFTFFHHADLYPFLFYLQKTRRQFRLPWQASFWEDDLFFLAFTPLRINSENIIFSRMQSSYW